MSSWNLRNEDKMELLRVSASEYKQVFPTPYSLFNSVEFSELNKEKCNDLHYLMFADKKKRLGIIVGEKDDSLRAPFSATYSGFSYNTAVALNHYDEACKLLREYVERLNKPLYITLPPPLYDGLDQSKTLGAMMRAGAKIQYIDYNHHFELSRFADYDSILDSKVRNKLHKSLDSGLKFEILNSKIDDDVARAYEVIRINHRERGNPLHMTLENVLETIKIIPADFFIVSNQEGIDVAAAQIFHTSRDTYQIVYWGDIPSFSHLKSMNYLSYKVFEYYFGKDVKRLDIGISTEKGAPNYGLCEFKENIGCYSTTRFSLILEG